MLAEFGPECARCAPDLPACRGGSRRTAPYAPSKRGHFLRQGHYFGYADGVFVDIYSLTPVGDLGVMAPTEAASDPSALQYWFMKVGMFAADGEGEEARHAGNARVALLHAAHIEAEARVNCTTALLRAAMPKVVVVGAADAIALASLRALAVRARGSLRLVAALHAPDPEALDAVRDMEGVELARVSLDDPASLHPALQAADAALVVPPRHEGGEAQALCAIGAAEQGGAGFIALFSVLTAEQEGTPLSAQFHRLEKAVVAASPPHAILRTAPLHDVFALGAETVRQGYLQVPGDGAATTATVDAFDVGAAAATILYSPHAHPNSVHELAGPACSFSDVAAAIGRAAGGELTYVRLSPEQFAERIASEDLTPHEARGIAEQLAFLGHARGQSPPAAPDALARLLGRNPFPFARWAKDHAALFQEEGE